MHDVQNLYTRYATPLYRYALALCRNRAEAEDLVSDTFVRLWASPGEIRQATVKAYLFTVLRHLFFSRHKRAKREVPLDEAAADRLPASDTASSAHLQLSRVQELLDLMSPLDREAVLMRGQGNSYEDIGTALGLSVGAARVRVHRVRAQLAKALGKTQGIMS